MKIISVNSSNIDQEHICCAIGNDKLNKNRAQAKKEWLKERFTEGLVFKKFDVRGKVFIEYMPIETTWKPIVGKNYMVINCLWVSGKYKGMGLSTQLLNECIQDAKIQKMDGIVVVSSTTLKPYLTDKKFYLRQDFRTIDSVLYFELLELKFNNNADSPKFSDNLKTGISYNEGFTFIYSNQCPFMEEYTHQLSIISSENSISSQIIKLNSYQEAQKIGNPWGTHGLYYNGEFLTHEIMSEKKFSKLIQELNTN